MMAFVVCNLKIHNQFVNFRFSYWKLMILLKNANCLSGVPNMLYICNKYNCNLQITFKRNVLFICASYVVNFDSAVALHDVLCVGHLRIRQEEQGPQGVCIRPSYGSFYHLLIFLCKFPLWRLGLQAVCRIWNGFKNFCPGSFPCQLHLSQTACRNPAHWCMVYGILHSLCHSFLNCHTALDCNRKWKPGIVLFCKGRIYRRRCFKGFPAVRVCGNALRLLSHLLFGRIPLAYPCQCFSSDLLLRLPFV